MDNEIEEAENFIKEAEAELEKGIKEENKLLLRDACEKGWNAVVLATNYLILKKEHKTVKSHLERRKALESLENKYTEIREKCIRDRFSARAYHLHEQGFYGGYFETDLIREEFNKVRTYIEDIKSLLKGGERSVK